MLPLLVLHGNQTDGKKRKVESTFEYATIDANTTMRNALQSAKDAIELLGMHSSVSNHLAHYVHNLKADAVFEMMLVSHFSMKFGSMKTPKQLHEQNRLMWMANESGNRPSTTKAKGAISKTEALVKKAVALELLRETYAADISSTNKAVALLDLLHVEMKQFNDGAIDFLNTMQNTKNNPMWFAKYRKLAWDDPAWM